jgi:hypothetical protein
MDGPPQDPHEAVMLLPIVFSPVFPSGCRAVLSVDSSNLHQQQALWAAWLVPEGVSDLCLVTDWLTGAQLMCMCTFSTYRPKMETDRLPENLCFLSKYEIMDTGQKLCNPSHYYILYTEKFINFYLDLPPPPQKKKNERVYKNNICFFFVVFYF